MTTLAVIQARVGSSRLPAKVLADLEGRSMLERVVRRARRARRLDAVVVATTVEPADRPIVETCDRLGIPCFRGSEDDVLDRYHAAARAHGARRVVRITSDCPLIDPGVIDRVVAALETPGAGDEPIDYAANILERTYPRGLDVEAMTFEALDRAWREAREPFERTHVTPYFYRHPELFRLASVRHTTDLHHHRWTVDTADDLALARAIYQRLGGDDRAGWLEILERIEAEPELAELNRHVRQKALEEG